MEELSRRVRMLEATQAEDRREGHPQREGIQERVVHPGDGDFLRIRMSKLTHRLRFENETEGGVDVIIEPKKL